MEQSEEIVTVYGRCKCCLDYGYMKNMWEEHSWDGEREIYGEMILDTFGLSLNTTDNSKEYICESCVSRLRDAASFKKEIVASEQLLLEHAMDSGDKEFIKAEIFNEENDTLNEPEKKKVKKEDPSQNEPTKYEIEFLDEDAELVQQSYNELNSQDNQDSDSDSIPAKKKKQGDVNRMYTKYTTEQLIKAVEAVYNNEMTELEASQRYNIPRRTLNARVNKRRMEAESNSQGQGDTASESDTVTKRKWPKKKKKEERSTSYRNYTHTDLKNCINAILNEEMNQVDAANFYNIPRKTVNCKINNIRKKTGECQEDDERQQNQEKHYRFVEEVKTLLTMMNCIPFKCKASVIFCAYCYLEGLSFEDPSDLRGHTEDKHANDMLTGIEYVLWPQWLNEMLRVDITRLACKECNVKIEGWNDMFQHLHDVHNIEFEQLYTRVVPYKLGKSLRCALCDEEYSSFNFLDGHINAHYNNYVCSECGDTFVAETRLKKHMQIHEMGHYPCDECGKVFVLKKYRTKHMSLVHNQEKKYKCQYCDEKFVSVNAKHNHAVEKHKELIKTYTCEICGKTFHFRPSFKSHMRKCHIHSKRYKCEHCNKWFAGKHDFKLHIIRIAGQGKHTCPVCEKKFVTAFELRSHYARIHSKEIDGNLVKIVNV